jgi:hypothetical protein
MKVKGLVVALAVGLLAAAPARAAWGINNATYASRFRSVPRPAASETKSGFQVAVMANSASQPGANPRPWGPARPFAVKSR